MKRNNLLQVGLVLFCSIFLFLGSCKKKDSNDDGSNSGDDPEVTFDYGSISMKVNGTSWSGIPEENYILVSDDIFTILGETENTSISMYGSEFEGEGLYSYAGNSDRFAIFNDMANFMSYMDTSNGAFTVGNYDAIAHRMSGTFTMDGFILSDPTQTVQITEGNFMNVPIVFSREQPPSVISFEIDGTSADIDYASSTTLPMERLLLIGYSSSSGEYYGELVFPFDLDPGTYTYKLVEPNIIRFWYDFKVPTNGALTITENDKVNHHIEGNFYCNVFSEITLESASITNGIFSIDY